MESKALLVYCSKHESKKIMCICPSHGCVSRLLCFECMKVHPSEHEPKFIPLLEAYLMDPDAEFQETKKILERNEERLKSDIGAVEKFFKELKEKVIADIDKIRDEHLAKLKEFSSGNFDSLKKNFEIAKQNLTSNQKDLYEKCNSFAEVLSQIIDIKLRGEVSLYKFPEKMNADLLKRLDIRTWILRPLGLEESENLSNNKWQKYSEHNLELKENATILEAKHQIGAIYVGGISSAILESGKVYKWSIKMRAINDGPYQGGLLCGIIPDNHDIDTNKIDWKSCIYIVNNGNIAESGTFRKLASAKNLDDNLIKFELDLIKQKFNFYVENNLYDSLNVKKENYRIVAIFYNVKGGYVELGELSVE